MPVSFVAAAQANGGSGSTAGYTVTIPSGAAVGDVAILAVSNERGSPPPTPSGWTSLRSTVGGSTNMSAVVAWKRLVSGDPGAAVSLDYSAGARRSSAAIVVYRGCDDPVITQGTYTANTTGQSTATCPAITPTVANSMLVGIVSANIYDTAAPGTTTSGTVASPYTERADGTSTNAGSNGLTYVADQLLTGGSGTSQAGAVMTAGVAHFNWIASTVALAPTATGTTLTLGQPTEADTAQAVPRQKSRTTGQGTETDSAQPVTRAHSRTLGQAAQIGTAQPVARVKIRTLGTAFETDTPQPVGRARMRSTGTALEADLSQPVARTHTRTLGQPSETDTATTLGRSHRRTLGQPGETDQANPAPRAHSRALGQAAEVDSTTPMARTHRRTIGQASEPDAAQAVARAKRRLLGQPAEVDTAQPVTPTAVGPDVLLIGQTAETDAAQPVRRVKTRTLGTATETGTAGPVTRRHARTLGSAGDIGLALPVTRVRRRPLGIAAEIDTARAVPLGHVRLLGTALEIDAAAAVTASVIAGVDIEVWAAQPLTDWAASPASRSSPGSAGRRELLMRADSIEYVWVEIRGTTGWWSANVAQMSATDGATWVTATVDQATVRSVRLPSGRLGQAASVRVMSSTLLASTPARRPNLVKITVKVSVGSEHAVIDAGHLRLT